MGCTDVDVAMHLTEGLVAASTQRFDAAVLDVNLRGSEVFPLADLLLQRGVPFSFASGYGPESIRADLRHHPLVRKPFLPRDLQESMVALLARAKK